MFADAAASGRISVELVVETPMTPRSFEVGTPSADQVYLSRVLVDSRATISMQWSAIECRIETINTLTWRGKRLYICYDCEDRVSSAAEGRAG